MAKQIPNADLFVVHLTSQNKDEISGLKSIGSTEDLGEDNTLLLRVNKKFSKPEAG